MQGAGFLWGGGAFHPSMMAYLLSQRWRVQGAMCARGFYANEINRKGFLLDGGDRVEAEGQQRSGPRGKRQWRPCGGVRSRGPACPAVQSRNSFLFQTRDLLSAQTAPGFLLLRKLKLREGKGLPEVTQQARGRKTCALSSEVVEPGQLGLCRGVKAALGPTQAVDREPLPQDIPPSHPHLPPGLPWAPAPRFCRDGDSDPPGWGPSHLLVIGFQGCSCS